MGNDSPSQLYPYHMQDVMVQGLRMTPFCYYSSMMHDMVQSERSYDSLPNFTAADCEPAIMVMVMLFLTQAYVSWGSEETSTLT